MNSSKANAYWLHESEAATSGAFTEPHDKNAPVYNLRNLIRFCDEHGVEPHELSADELKKFEIAPKQNPTT